MEGGIEEGKWRGANGGGVNGVGNGGAYMKEG